MPTIANVFCNEVMEAIHSEEAELRDEALYGMSYRRSWQEEPRFRLREREPVHALVRQLWGKRPLRGSMS